MSKVGLDGSEVARRNEERRAQFDAGDPLDQGVIDGLARRAPTTPAQQRVLGIVNPCFSGFNAFVGGGSFEVFYKSWGDSGGPDFPDQGWYWWSCWPGCLPDGDPSGPFPTAEGAYLDAIGE